MFIKYTDTDKDKCKDNLFDECYKVNVIECLLVFENADLKRAKPFNQEQRLECLSSCLSHVCSEQPLLKAPCGLQTIYTSVFHVEQTATCHCKLQSINEHLELVVD